MRRRTKIYSSFILLPVLAAVKVTVQGVLSKKSTQKPIVSAIILNAWIFLFSFFVMTAIFVRRIPSTRVLLPAVLYASTSIFFQISYVLAFSSGPVALAGTLNNFGIVIPMLAGILFYGEEPSAVNIIGMILLVIPLILIPKTEKGVKINVKWLIFTLLALIGNGLVNTVLVYVAHEGFTAEESREAVIFGYAIGSAVLFLIGTAMAKKPVYKGESFGKFALLITVIALCLGFYNILLAQALRSIASSVLYPVVNVLSISAFVLSDFLLYRQKSTKRQAIGLFAAAVCVVLLNI